MSKSLYKDQREVARSELAAELRRIATDLESSPQLRFGDDEQAQHVAVADRLEREIEVEQTRDGTRTKVEIEFAWNS